MKRQARRSFGLQLAVLATMAALSACDETAQPRPPQPDAATRPDGGGGGSGGSAGVGGGGGGSGGSGPPGCSATTPPLLPAELTAAALGARYSQQLSIVGATAAEVSWSVVGALPSGLTLVEDDNQMSGPPLRAVATLSGTPTAAGTFPFSVTVSLIVPPMCATPPARRDYELVVSDDADAGSP